MSYIQELENTLKKYSSNQSYAFKPIPPVLFQYNSFASYVVDAINNREIFFCSPQHFNDVYDASVYTTPDYEKSDKKVKILETFPGINIDEAKKVLRNAETDNCKKNNTIKERFHLYVSCFSQKNDSILMWSHYAQKNQGICIGYNFNNLQDKLLKDSLFPVMYSERPIDLSRFFNDSDPNIRGIGLFAAVLAKANCWSYENEWRFINTETPSCFDPEKPDYNEKYIPKKINIDPCGIYLGRCFLENFLSPVESSSLANPINSENKTVPLSERLLQLCEEKSIPIYYMMPNVDSYGFTAKEMSVEKIKVLFAKKFYYNSRTRGKLIRLPNLGYYNNLHERFLECELIR